MADNFNHADVDTICEIVTKSLHKQADEESTYFTKSKFMNDYSNVFTAEEIEQFQDVKGRQSKENFNKNKIFKEVDEFRRLSQTRQLWQIPACYDLYDEDNDTEEESSDDEDDLDQEQSEKMNEFADGLKDLINIQASKKFFSAVRAGFALKFFIRQEEKFLEGVKQNKPQTVELDEEGLPKNLEFRPIEEY